MFNALKTNQVLIIGYVWPEPKTTAAGHRMLQLIHAFKNKDYKITFVTTASKTTYSKDLEALGIKTEAIELNNSSFDVFIKELNPEIVIFDRFMVEEQFGWRVAEHAPNALRILNTEDLHSLRKTREICHKKDDKHTNAIWLANDIAKREIASIYRSDLTLLISEIETALLKSACNLHEDLLHTLPFLLDIGGDKNSSAVPSFEDRQEFIFIGNGKHAPNIDAIQYLKTEIWPLLRKELPNSKLNIYGAYLPQYILEFHKPKDGFYVHGWAADLDSVMQNARVNLAPLRFGAGLKGKVIDGMRNGTPTVTTRIGAEGIPNFTAVYETPSKFVAAAVSLYSNKERWLEIQVLGFNTLKEHFSKEEQSALLFQKITALQQKLVTHRASNFIGAMLHHQTMASTKYMSKWIEEKNKKK